MIEKKRKAKNVIENLVDDASLIHSNLPDAAPEASFLNVRAFCMVFKKLHELYKSFLYSWVWGGNIKSAEGKNIYIWQVI